MGAFVDSVRWFQQPFASEALRQMDQGEMDLYTALLRRPADIEAALANPNLTVVDGGGLDFNLFANPVPVNEEFAPGVFNPFALREVREALNYVVDRDLLVDTAFGGQGRAHVVPWDASDPEWIRNPFVFHDLEGRYRHDFDRAREMIFAALTAAGATYDGTWRWQGNEIVIQLISRIEDQRFQVGDYLANTLSSLGFAVNLRALTGSRALSLVYLGPADTGAWMLYTEGWASTFRDAWPDADLNFYHTGGFFTTVWESYEADPELRDIADRLAFRRYSSVEERRQLVARGAELALRESVRVWLLTSGQSVHSNRITGLVSDLTAGLTSSFPVRTARFESAGGILQVRQPFFLVTPWQPWRGFGSVFDRVVAETFADSGVVLHPHTGKYVPLRSEFKVTTAGPDGSLGVPADAIRYDPALSAWTAVGAGTTATSVVSFHYTFGEWHHGVPMTMDDVLHQVALFARRSEGDVASRDPNALDPDAILFQDRFRGLSIVDSNTLDVYLDYWHVDPSLIAATSDVWPSTPWEVSELAMLTTLHDHTRVSESTALSEGRDVIDLALGSTIGWMDGEIASGNVTTSGAEATRPAGFEAFIDPGEAEARWAALQTWRNSVGHYFPSNGPFSLESVHLDIGHAILNRDASYPSPADRWDGLIGLADLGLSIGHVEKIEPGEDESVSLTVRLNGAPHDDASIDYRIVRDSDSVVVLSGTPTFEGSGQWTIDLSASFTSTLVPGKYRIEAFASSDAAPLLAFASRAFLVEDEDGG